MNPISHSNIDIYKLVNYSKSASGLNIDIFIQETRLEIFQNIKQKHGEMPKFCGFESLY